MPAAQTPTLTSFREIDLARATAVIVLVCTGAVAFLFWLIYFRQTTDGAREAVSQLPALNASLNALSTVLLVAGYRAVRRRDYLRHTRLMIAALASSALFLASYITYYAFAGNTPFEGQGIVRPVYFAILASHIVLSIVALPLVLLTVFLSLAGRFPLHRRIARYTLPLWLYVSVTGVLVFVLLRLITW